jgi:hypothetical protein
MKSVTTKAGVLIAGFAALLGFNIINAPAAQAGNFNDVWHAADDGGYTAMIQIECSDGRRFWLAKGDGSPSRCGFHVKRIIVGWDQTVRCFNNLPPYQTKTYYTGNFNEVPSGSSMKCYMQRPL